MSRPFSSSCLYDKLAPFSRPRIGLQLQRRPTGRLVTFTGTWHIGWPNRFARPITTEIFDLLACHLFRYLGDIKVDRSTRSTIVRFISIHCRGFFRGLVDAGFRGSPIRDKVSVGGMWQAFSFLFSLSYSYSPFLFPFFSPCRKNTFYKRFFIRLYSK